MGEFELEVAKRDTRFKKGSQHQLDAAAKGGRSRRRAKIRTATPDEAPPAPQTLEDCRRWLSWLAHSVATGVIDSETARITVQSLAELRRTIDSHEMEKKIRELQAIVNELKRERA